MQLRLHPDARDELWDAVQYYEAVSERLADRFLDHYSEALEKVRARPDAWERVDDDCQRCVLKKFPYSLIYRLAGETIRVLAVAHHKRRPRYWQKRLKDFED